MVGVQQESGETGEMREGGGRREGGRAIIHCTGVPGIIHVLSSICYNINILPSKLIS